MGLLNPGGSIAQFERNRCSIPPVEVILRSGVRSYIPPNVTERAVSIRDQADKSGILDTLHKLGVHNALVPYSSRLADLSIDEMNLTVRSSNGLKRANIHTFGALKEVLAIENGLLNIRNIGQKSIKEIKQIFFAECYVRLLPYERAQYWQELLDIQNHA